MGLAGDISPVGVLGLEFDAEPVADPFNLLGVKLTVLPNVVVLLVGILDGVASSKKKPNTYFLPKTYHNLT